MEGIIIFQVYGPTKEATAYHDLIREEGAWNWFAENIRKVGNGKRELYISTPCFMGPVSSLTSDALEDLLRQNRLTIPENYTGPVPEEVIKIESFIWADERKADELARIAQERHDNPSYISAQVVAPEGEVYLSRYVQRASARLIWTPTDGKDYLLASNGKNPKEVRRSLSLRRWHNQGAERNKKILRRLAGVRFGI